MDEPLSNLDAKLRVETRTQLAELQRRLATTTVYVTHDQVEAMTMGDRVAVMKDGVLLQLGAPLELYDSPINAFVAGFIGSPAMSLFELPINEQGVLIGNHEVRLPRRTISRATENGQRSVQIGVRPEDLLVSSDGSGIEVLVEFVEELGADAFAYGKVRSGHGSESKIVARIDGRQVPKHGDVIRVTVREERAHVFSTDTGLNLTRKQ
jgi:multiple sugar transport system ATP-binding protein